MSESRINRIRQKWLFKPKTSKLFRKIELKKIYDDCSEGQKRDKMFYQSYLEDESKRCERMLLTCILYHAIEKEKEWSHMSSNNVETTIDTEEGKTR